jgi:hypothetical protein
MIDATEIQPGSDWSKELKDQTDVLHNISTSLCISSPTSLLEYVTCVVCLDSLPKQPFELQCGHIGML